MLDLNLCSNKKVKLKKERVYKYALYLKTPKICGDGVWEMLPAMVQKATTKVKFKALIKQICRTI